MPFKIAIDLRSSAAGKSFSQFLKFSSKFHQDHPKATTSLDTKAKAQ